MNTSAIKKIKLQYVEFENEKYLKISNHDAMRPFFMSVVSDSNHWMFISSNGGLTAGRKNPEISLFPYYTEDKITEFADITGSKSIFQVSFNGDVVVWEPFSERFTGKFEVSRNIYKSVYGNKIVLEEINRNLGLTFRYQWNSSKVFGFVRNAELVNDSENEYKVSLVDGIQNIMPYGVPSDLQATTSNLVDAYKRSELEQSSGIGIFALSAIIVDKAEPSEALKANIAWSLWLSDNSYLLSSLQLNSFRRNEQVVGECDVKGEKGAFFVCSKIELPANSNKKWKIIANVNQTHAQIISLANSINSDENLFKKIEADIDSGTEDLKKLVAGADGFQLTSDLLNDTRHYSNVLFNIMRGGTFDNNYQIEIKDFIEYLEKANNEVLERNSTFFDNFDEEFSLSWLMARLEKTNDPDLKRLCIEYLPIKFSRRHGDPSRPWNYFSINTQSEVDGSKILDYEGNWRDLFQNWEALAHSYPEFITGMIFKFLNASTFDGYNPYRVTKDGFDWETIEPDNPWSYIGYWGDHQIIYLQKFFEIIEKTYPGTLQSYFDKDLFVYAAVPYIIRSYEKILLNPKETIEFDHKWDMEIRRQRDILGADGALLMSAGNEIYHVNLIEKILATVLAKMSNFIAEAGIWMNTQRPEWNDANNALVGNGVSMVTLYYLYRFMKFFQGVLDRSNFESVKISSELLEFYHSVREALQEFAPMLKHSISDKDKKVILDRLGNAASEYRQQIYNNGFWGKKRSASLKGLKTFNHFTMEFLEHSIKANQRPDKLFNAYNLMTVSETGISCSNLSEMLEGQVAVLSSGYLSSEESLEVLDALKASKLYRSDQYSYVLYPNKDLPGFLQKNTIAQEDAKSSELIAKLVDDGNMLVVEKDIEGVFHFNGNFKNASDLNHAIDSLPREYTHLVKKDRELLLELFEKVFNHKAFTGRSGTFFSYEGLGSIYWHMVSKLHLAVQECCLKALEEKSSPEVIGRLLEHYYEIEAGIGVHKSPELYGAFPTDPYSHTPQHRGAQQPGMTGQVKEDILVRFAELGVFVHKGQICFYPSLLRKQEFIAEPRKFDYYDVKNKMQQVLLNASSLAFTFCQVPVVYQLAKKNGVAIEYHVGKTVMVNSLKLDEDTSKEVLQRTGNVRNIKVSIIESMIN